MARCTSVDPLGFHIFALGLDSLIVKYDNSKADKDGDRLSEKIFMQLLTITFFAFGQA